MEGAVQGRGPSSVSLISFMENPSHLNVLGPKEGQSFRKDSGSPGISAGVFRRRWDFEVWL